MKRFKTFAALLAASIALFAALTMGALAAGEVEIDLNSLSDDPNNPDYNYYSTSSPGLLYLKEDKSYILKGSYTGTSDTGYQLLIQNPGTIVNATDVDWSNITLENWSNGKITGGEFDCEVTNQSSGNIGGGTFYGTVTNQNGGTITNGGFGGAVTNQSGGSITGGTFYGTVTNESSGSITGVNFPGMSMVVNNGGTLEGCTFNGPVINNGGTLTGCTFNGPLGGTGPFPAGYHKVDVTVSDTNADEAGPSTEWAKKDTWVSLDVTLNNPGFHPVVTAEDTTLTLTGPTALGDNNYILSFDMPDHAVTLTVTTAPHQGDWTPEGNGHKRTCTVCKKIETADHSYGGWSKVDNTNHKRTCVCGLAETAAHSGGTATCTAQAVCSGCGASYGPLAEHALAAVPRVEPTVSQEGRQAHDQCTICGKRFLNGAEVTEAELSIPRLEPTPQPDDDDDDDDYSEPTYGVDLPSRVEGGKLSISPKYARRGQTVTLTATPDEGYEVARLTVTDRKGNAIKVTEKAGGKYTFTMPGSRVEIEVQFAELAPPEPEPEPEPTPLPFGDVAEHAWYAEAVRYVYESGLMQGVGPAGFAPDASASRGMLVTILYRMAGSPDIEDEIWGYPFADVDSTDWYGTAVYWARLSGIAGGYSDAAFGPGDPISREQLAVMLYRFAGQPPADTGALDFSDAEHISDFARSAMGWAVEQGILSGKGGGALDPQGQATRAEVAAMLHRFAGA